MRQIFTTALAMLLCSFLQANATVFTVTNMNDAGAGSLRQAILDANANPGNDVIIFNASVTDSTLLVDDGDGTFNDTVFNFTDGVTIAGLGTEPLRLVAIGAYKGAEAPTISTAGTLTPFALCDGVLFSAEQTFTVVGAGLSDNLLVTAPRGFEVSTTSGTGYSESISLTPMGGTVPTTTIFVRLTPEFFEGSDYIKCTSTGTAEQNVAVSAVNAVPLLGYIAPGDCYGIELALTNILFGDQVTLNYDIDGVVQPPFSAFVISPDGFTGTALLVTPPLTVNNTITFSVASGLTGCSSRPQPIIMAVNAPLTVSAGSYGPICIDSGFISLAGLPSGGTWTGTGVSGSAGNYKFNPAAGTQTLTYEYFNSNGTCGNSSQTTIKVNQPVTWYLDADGDTHYVNTVTSCESPGEDYNTTGGTLDDCDDNDITKWQSALLYIDIDGDHYNAGQLTVCYGANIPAGYSATTSGGDCNDVDESIHAPITYYKDNDGDGFGNRADITVACSYTPPAGYVTNSSDCDDTKKLYNDNDGDGYGAGSAIACGGVTTNTDCNDSNPAISPAAVEVCKNNIDDNCNGIVDDKATCEKCDNASNLNTTNITSASAQLNWSAIANPEQWRIQYKSTKPNSKWVAAPLLEGTIRSVNISSLIADQNYSWQISAKCNGSWTNYSSSANFKTLANDATSSRLNNSTIATDISTTERVNANIKLYPNPSKGQFVVELYVAEKINANLKIRLLDMTGKTVYIGNAVMNNGVLQKTVTPSTVLANGIYMVRIIVNNDTYKATLVYEK